MKFRKIVVAAALVLSGMGAAQADEAPSGLFEVPPFPELPPGWSYGAGVELAPEIVIGDISGPEGIIGSSAIAAVPEPQTYALLGAGLLLIGAIRRRQQHR